MVEAGSGSLPEKNIESIALKFKPKNIFIHDAARPWLTENLVENLLLKLSEDQSIQGVFPVVSITDSLREKTDKELIPVDRENFLSVQTPQIFNAKVLHESLTIAVKEGLEYSDESQAVENAGFKISFSKGLPKNIKITTPDDLYSLSAHDVFVGRVREDISTKYGINNKLT